MKDNLHAHTAEGKIFKSLSNSTKCLQHLERVSVNCFKFGVRAGPNCLKTWKELGMWAT